MPWNNPSEGVRIPVAAPALGRVLGVTDDLALAAELVRSAGALAARMRLAGVDATRKTSISDIVTAADHAAEDLIVARLREARPEDGIVGEEGTNQPGRRTWFADPVDGTYNYAAGLTVWCAALALRDPDGLVLGSVYHPANDELWLGGRDHPTSLNGTPVEPLADVALSHCSIATYIHPTTLPDDAQRIPLLRVVSRAATVRMMGSGSVELASVAAGRLGAYIQTDCLDWDWLPGQALVEAAGGVTELVPYQGHLWHLAGNRQVVADMKAALTGS